MKKINLVIYGATGSIGKSVLSIVRNNRKKFNVQGITCNKKFRSLIKIAREFHVKRIGFNSKIKQDIKEFNEFNIYENISNLYE
mgnify:CR=1 FL=1